MTVLKVLLWKTVFTVGNATSTRKLIGYILLDLRTTKPLNQVVPEWYKVLNVSVRGPCPELFISLGLEEQVEKAEKTTALPQFSGSDNEHVLLTLHPSCEYYFLGTQLPQQQMFVLSITLDNPASLPEPSSIYYYCYNLVGNEIVSERFGAADFKAEKASIRIKCTREKLGMLFSQQQHMQV
jgi:hypothetical protein